MHASSTAKAERLAVVNGPAVQNSGPSTVASPGRAVSLPAALYGFVGLGAILFAVTAAGLVSSQVDVFQHRALEEAVQVRTRGAADAFGRSLGRDWNLLKSVRSSIPIGNPASLRAALTVLTSDGNRIAWAGYAGSDGTVLASSRGLLEGADVSERPWFQMGLTGPFAGDVHEAVLLNRILGGTEEDPIRFLDLAAPVKGPDGQTAGVVGFHINSDWAQEFLTATAESLELDLFLINFDGKVVAATDEVGESLNLPSVRAATAGVQASSFETWPDGRRYFTTVIPQIAQGDLPPFGWRLVGRIDPAEVSLAGDSLRPAIAKTLVGAGVILLMLCVIFARLFLAPVAILARAADRLADGHDDYPVEVRRTAELASLSAALARLQGRLGKEFRAAGD